MGRGRVGNLKGREKEEYDPPLYSFSPTVSVSVVRRGCSMTEIEEGRGRWTGEFGEEGFAHKPGLKSILWIFSFMFKCRLSPPPHPIFLPIRSHSHSYKQTYIREREDTG